MSITITFPHEVVATAYVDDALVEVRFRKVDLMDEDLTAHEAWIFKKVWELVTRQAAKDTFIASCDPTPTPAPAPIPPRPEPVIPGADW